MLVLFSGRPLAISWEAEHVPAILAAWFPGVQAGPALARTLYGDVNPCGRLTASFPRSVGQEPIYYNTFNTGRPAPARTTTSPVTSTSATRRSSPFGWGLSYTHFDYSPARITTPQVSVAELERGGAIHVEATVRNAGPQSGYEVVQLYIRLRGTSVARPVRELKGFEKIALAPGESRTVRFSLTKKELAFWNIEMRNVVEPCELTLWIAPNCQAGHEAKVMIGP